MNNIENETHIRKTYKDKTENLLKISMGIMTISLLTYLGPLIFFKAFDFGMIFEIITLVLIVIAYNKIGQNHFKTVKKCIIIAMISIGWLIIYDFINLLANIKEVLIEVFRYYFSFDQFFYYIEPYLVDVFLVATIILLYKTYSALKKAERNEPLEPEDYSDTFYDKL